MQEILYFFQKVKFPFVITKVCNENLGGQIVIQTAIHIAQKRARRPPLFIVFLQDL
jgi:hypothetical protein